MVDVKLEALDLENPDANTYVAVRIGESQKLRKLSAEYNFKFNKDVCGTRRFGKVDIFKKVGTASIAIIAETGEPVQEFEIDPSDNPGAKYKMRATIVGDAMTDKTTAKELSGSVLEAKDYLAEHNLEMVLKDAMQAVLRDKPANPREYISQKLKESEGMYRTGQGRAQTAPEGATRPVEKEAEAAAAAAAPADPAATPADPAPADAQAAPADPAATPADPAPAAEAAPAGASPADAELAELGRLDWVAAEAAPADPAATPAEPAPADA